MELLRTRDPILPLNAACEVLGVPRATARRHLAPPVFGPRRARPTSHRKFDRSEEQLVLDTLHSERFEDQSPRQVYAELLDEGQYIGSPSTMYRILAAHGESHERRNQRGALARRAAARSHCPESGLVVGHFEARHVRAGCLLEPLPRAGLVQSLSRGLDGRRA